ncbi:unnamed protein product [Brassica napus]|uniref:(rape) hypothetical protein n=1 Tax=Brassica napus TaxID=3708 RepID=A0A816Z567_BRANA|nr:unnamed protein product [Brassica napus]
MDSLKSDSNPLAKVPATVDVATVDPSVDMVLPTSGTPPLATISGGSFSASPKESDQPISTVTTSNAWSKPSPSLNLLLQLRFSCRPQGTDSRFVQRNSVALAFGSQLCSISGGVNLLLGQSTLQGLLRQYNSYSSSVTAKVPLVPSASVVAVNTPTGSFTEKVHVSCTPSETVQVTHVTAVTDEKELPPPTVVSVSPNDETCKQLDVSVSPNDETCKQLDVAEPVDSSTQSVPPTPEAPSGKFVGNVDIVVDNSNSSPSSVPFVHDNLFAVLDSADASEPSSVPPAKELVFSNSPLPFTFASHDTSPIHPRDPFVDDESTLRSRGGRPLKPSQRLKEMEWFTVTGKGKRGRGRGPHH